jgi:serine/threonine protein kinase
MTSDYLSNISARGFLTSAITEQPILTEAEYSLISLLGIAQQRGLDFLPITWQMAEKLVGEGGTSVVNDALINLEFSFAFKRVSNEHKTRASHEDSAFSNIFKELATEVFILTNSSIRKHPNIIRLEGICWDIDTAGSVWPVLVFQKSQHGDLHSFLSRPLGKSMDYVARTRLCIDIGKAIRDLHLQSKFNRLITCNDTDLGKEIIHGDVKPANVLIFENEPGTFTAKVIDFGYSTIFSDQENHVRLPRSVPWSAPEHHFWGFTPEMAQQADKYSYGMLCLWVLHKEELESIAMSELSCLESLQGSLSFQMDPILQLLEEKKRNDRLVAMAHEIIQNNDTLSETDRDRLATFFSFTLEKDPKRRGSDFEGLLSLLSLHEYVRSQRFYYKTTDRRKEFKLFKDRTRIRYRKA